MQTCTCLSIAIAFAPLSMAAGQEPAPTPAPRLVWEDLDGDGLPEVLVLAPGRDDTLLRNLGDGRFAEGTAFAGLNGLRSRSVLVEDLDRDGRRDLLSVTQGGAVRLFRNLGGGAFEEATASSGLGGLDGVVAVTRLDVDVDGWGDLGFTFVSGPQQVLRNREGGLLEPLELELPALVSTPDTPGMPAAAAGSPASPERPPAEVPPPAGAGSRRLFAPVDVAIAGLNDPALPASAPPNWSATPIYPPACVQSLADAAGAGCIGASSVPELGSLYPLSSDLFVDASTGFVGVGTTAPQGRLDVSGTLFSTNVQVAQDLFALQDLIAGQHLTVSDDAFLLGDVGIGTGLPQADLHLRNSGSLELLLEADWDNSGENDHPSIRFSQDGGVVQSLIAFNSGSPDDALASAILDGG